MNKIVHKIVKSILPQFALNFRRQLIDKKQYQKWVNSGSKNPPPHLVKQNTIRDYQKQYGFNILIETGTYKGDMVEAQKRNFKKIISIEIGKDLFEDARKRFRNDKNITIVQGDSGKVLPLILKEVHEAAIFWLDGHYSAGVTAKGDKECPIYEELDAVCNGNLYSHVILIDDARLFNGKGSYPTIGDLTKYIKQRNEKYNLRNEHDILRYTID